jgi:rubrerythrin
MDKWHSIDEVLDFAIGEENAAAEFYTHLADQSKTPGMRQIFEGFAQEEMEHKAKLEGIKAGGTLRPAGQPVADLKMAEYVVDVAPSPDMNYQGSLVLAMKKEKAAFRLYTDLAASAGDDKVKATFLALAQEEARHKLRFEIEYDDMLAEN